jgi:uncharacterized membrane-anchored protein
MTARPWPVVLLTALGAWLAAIPFFAVAALLLSDALREPTAALVLGVVMLGGAVTLLRAQQHSLFVEQLAVPVLLAALGLIAWGLIKPLGWQGTMGALSLTALGLAASLTQPWLRATLGAGAALLALMACGTHSSWWGGHPWLSPWVSLHLAIAIWLGTLWSGHANDGKAQPSAMLSDIGEGWVAATLLALAWWSGTSFLLGGLTLGTTPQHESLATWWVHAGLDLGSATVALVAVAGVLWRWPALRQAWCAGLGLVLCALSAFMPALGGVLLVAAACLVTRRWRMALWAAAVALWVVGAFYYQLRWPLANKAGVLLAAGVILAVLAAWGQRSAPPGQQAWADTQRPPQRLASTRHWSLVLGTLTALLVANGAIWQHESIIRNGRPIFVALAPVDPRSLMQGDYMALRFSTDDFIIQNDAQAPAEAPLQLVFKVDQQGVATVVRAHRGEALAPGELIIQMRRKQGRWMLVTDAFYFKEGEGQRWAAARYGELRVDAKGRALLVGLRNERLAQISVP